MKTKKYYKLIELKYLHRKFLSAQHNICIIYHFLTYRFKKTVHIEIFLFYVFKMRVEETVCTFVKSADVIWRQKMRKKYGNWYFFYESLVLKLKTITMLNKINRDIQIFIIWFKCIFIFSMLNVWESFTNKKKFREYNFFFLLETHIKYNVNVT